MYRDKKKVIIVVMIAMICIMAVGYAAFSTVLDITGIANVTSNWDVYFSNVVTTEKVGGATNINEPVYSGLKATMNVDLKEPGDYIVYTVTITNGGTLDAIIDKIDATVAGSDAIKYSINSINVGDTLAVNENKVFTVTVEYDKTITTQPDEITAVLTLNLNCIQDFNQDISGDDVITNNIATVTLLSGNNTLSINNNFASYLYNYKIEGNSVQNGTPSPESPVEIQSVGDRTKNLIDYTKAENGTLGSSTGQNLSETAYPNRCRSPFIYLEAGDYVISFSELISTGTKLHTYSKADQTTYISSIDLKRNGSVSTFTLSSASYIRYTIQPIDTSSDLVLNTETLKEYKPMLEKGTTPTDYEPYGYKIPVKVSNGIEEVTTNIYLDEPLRKIGDYYDYIDFKSKKVVRNIYSEYLTTVTAKSSVPGTYSVFLSDISNKPFIKSENGNTFGYVMSNKFQYTDKGYTEMVTYPNLIQSYITTGGINKVAYSFDNTSINTVALAQEKIGEGFEVNYVLATPDPQPIDLPNIYIPSGNVTVSINSNGIDVPIMLTYYTK